MSDNVARAVDTAPRPADDGTAALLGHAEDGKMARQFTPAREITTGNAKAPYVSLAQ